MSGTGQKGRWVFDEQGNCRFVPETDNSSAQNRQSSTDYGQQSRYDDRNRQWENTQKPQQWQTGKNSDSAQKKGDAWQWVVIVCLFMFGLWPIAVILMILKAKGIWSSKGSGQTSGTESWQNVARQVSEQVSEAGHEVRKGISEAYRNVQSEVQTNRRNSAASDRSSGGAAGRKAAHDADSREKRRAWARWAKEHGLGHVGLFRVLGAVITGIFGLALLGMIGESFDLPGLLIVLSFFAGGVSLLGVAGIRSGKLKRYQRYLTMIGSQDEVSVAAVARTLGYSEKRVTKDFQDMLDCGVFARGYLDVERQLLVLREWTPQQEPAAEENHADASANASVSALRRIREINNNIADPAMSDKIDRIEAITAKILRLLEENPDKADELRSFLNYYLPETMNILDRYSRLEAQGVDSRNIASAKQQIEETTDKLVKAFETQLDKLFETDVLDISADLKVMETMLEKDGLTEDGLHL